MRSLIILTIGLLLVSCGGDDDKMPENSTNNFTVTTLGTSFNGSGGLVVDASGNIYVADFGDQLSNANGTTITKITPDGEFVQFALGLQGASGNAFDSNGNLFQSNIAGNSVSRITPDGEVTAFATSNLRSPVGIAIDRQDNLFVCNCGGNSITKITPDGTSEIFISSDLLSCPNGMTIDDNDNLYPVNFNDGLVLKVTPTGDIETLVTLESRSAHITFSNNRLYVVGRSLGLVYEVTLEGESRVIAGTSGEIGNNDGPALEATFAVPNGIDASPDGSKLYVTSKVTGQGSQLNPVLLRVIHLTE